MLLLRNATDQSVNYIAVLRWTTPNLDSKFKQNPNSDASHSHARCLQVDDGESRQVSAACLAQLRAWTDEFLAGGYNPLMEVIRKDAEPGLGISRLSRQEFAKFLRLAAAVTAYVRLRQEGEVKKERERKEAAKKAAAQAAKARAMRFQVSGANLLQCLGT